VCSVHERITPTTALVSRVGAFPLVPSGPFNALYDQLPLLVVEDYSVISSAFLEEQYARMLRETYLLEKLFAPYWFARIMNDSLTAQQQSFRSAPAAPPRWWWWC
jgi:hypothetical protein